MRKFYKIFLFVATLNLTISGALFSTEKSKPLTKQEIIDFNISLKQKSDTTTSLFSKFIQEKNLEMLNKKMISKGIFKFKKEDKIAFLYELPFKYHMIINGNKLKIDNNGKSQLVDLKSNPLMKEMKILIEASFLGKLSQMGLNYKITYFQNENSILVYVVPTNKTVYDFIKQITIIFHKNTLDVIELRLEEGANSVTKYIFTDPKYNTISDDESFNIS